MSSITLKPQGVCSSCYKREATCHWSEGSIATIHGFVENLCKLCVVNRQLDHAEKMAVTIGKLKEEKAQLERDLPELSKEEIEKISYIKLDSASGIHNVWISYDK